MVVHPALHLLQILLVDLPLVHKGEPGHAALGALSILQLESRLQLDVLSVHQLLLLFVSHSDVQEPFVEPERLVPLMEPHLADVLVTADQATMRLLLLHGYLTLQIYVVLLVDQFDVELVQDVVHLLLVVRIDHHLGT